MQSVSVAVMVSETYPTMKRFLILVVVALISVMCRPAQAILIEIGTNTYTGTTDSASEPSDLLTIAYEVDFSSVSNVFTYDYTLTTTPGELLTSFTLGGGPDPINTTGLDIINYGGAVVGASGFTSDSVIWGWGPLSDTTSALVSFTSPIGPENATFIVSDDDIAWSAPAPIPAPVPEPSSFALLAGMIFVCGLFRYRKALSLKPKNCPQKTRSHVR